MYEKKNIENGKIRKTFPVAWLLKYYKKKKRRKRLLLERNANSPFHFVLISSTNITIMPCYILLCTDGMYICVYKWKERHNNDALLVQYHAIKTSLHKRNIDVF